jgi:parallel beta-helix repeat protein
MKYRTILISIILVVGSFIGIIDWGSENAEAPPTYVSGAVYNGNGGPWTLSGSPYIATGSINVPAGETLTIYSGVEVKFGYMLSFRIYGKLIAQGTASNMITITSNLSSPSPRSWYGIIVQSPGRIEIVNTNIMYADDGILIYGGKDNIISNNNISSFFGEGIELISSSSNIITSNSIVSGVFTGIQVSLSHSNTIENNKILGTPNGIWVSSSTLNSVNNNRITASHGIWLSGSSKNTVANNEINFWTDGIFVNFANDDQLSNNRISNVRSPPITEDIRIYNSENTYLSNNELSFGLNIDGDQLSHYNTHTILTTNVVNNKPIYYHKNESGFDINGIAVGQLILSNCTNMSVKNLQINNTFIGTEITYSNNLTMVQNNYTNNYHGLRIILSEEIEIFHNNFINNAFQAYDDTNQNHWNDTYPSGGNFWSDYSYNCPDLYSGSITPQTTGSPDGICDIQYDINTNGHDFYPLADFFGIRIPAPPTNLTASLEGANSENLRISWDASSDDPGNVTGYAIYRGNQFNINGLGYNHLTTIPATGSSNYNHTIQGMGEGHSENSFFFILSATSVFFCYSKSKTQVSKFSVNQMNGSHITSVPLILGESNITNVLHTLSYSIVSSYGNTGQLSQWKSYNPMKPYPQSLTAVNHTMGLWINVVQDSNLTVAGVVPGITNVSLKAGWNLVGYPSFAERTVSDALSSIVYERIEGHDDTSPQDLKLYTDTDIMKPGYGYWIKVPFDQTWTVVNI